jgi:hypothetical protein
MCTPFTPRVTVTNRTTMSGRSSVISASAVVASSRPASPTARSIAGHTLRYGGLHVSNPDHRTSLLYVPDSAVVLGRAPGARARGRRRWVKAGSLPNFGYSSAMKGADFVWDPGKLDSFIAKPDEVVLGNNMKPYGGLASAEDRTKLIAFLQSTTD